MIVLSIKDWHNIEEIWEKLFCNFWLSLCSLESTRLIFNPHLIQLGLNLLKLLISLILGCYIPLFNFLNRVICSLKVFIKSTILRNYAIMNDVFALKRALVSKATSHFEASLSNNIKTLTHICDGNLKLWLIWVSLLGILQRWLWRSLIGFPFLFTIAFYNSTFEWVYLLLLFSNPRHWLCL